MDDHGRRGRPISSTEFRESTLVHLGCYRVTARIRGEFEGLDLPRRFADLSGELRSGTGFKLRGNEKESSRSCYGLSEQNPKSHFVSVFERDDTVSKPVVEVVKKTTSER